MKLTMFRLALLLIAAVNGVLLIWADPIFRFIGIKPQLGQGVLTLVCLIALGWLLRTSTAAKHEALIKSKRKAWEANLEQEDARHAERMRRESLNG